MDTKQYIDHYVEKLTKDYRAYGNLIIGYDFDNTISPLSDFSITYIHEVRSLLIDLARIEGMRFIVITCREGEELRMVEAKLIRYGLPYNAINQNLPLSISGDPRKIFCNIMLDDKCGLPISVEILQQLYTLLHNG